MTSDVALPARLSTKELAALWKLTDARVGQFAKAGKITKGADQLFDRDQALAFRAAQMSKEETRVLFQHGKGFSAPKITEHVERKLSLQDILFGEEDDEPEAAPVAPADMMSEAMKRNAALTSLRLTKEQLAVDRAQQRAQREAGEVVPRIQVYKDAQGAAATVQRLLRTLEHEIPMIFADRAVRPDVRQKVSGVVDRCLHAIEKMINKYESSDNVVAPTSSEPEDD